LLFTTSHALLVELFARVCDSHGCAISDIILPRYHTTMIHSFRKLRMTVLRFAHGVPRDARYYVNWTFPFGRVACVRRVCDTRVCCMRFAPFLRDVYRVPDVVTHCYRAQIRTRYGYWFHTRPVWFVCDSFGSFAARSDDRSMPTHRTVTLLCLRILSLVAARFSWSTFVLLWRFALDAPVAARPVYVQHAFTHVPCTVSFALRLLKLVLGSFYRSLPFCYAYFLFICRRTHCSHSGSTPGDTISSRRLRIFTVWFGVSSFAMVDGCFLSCLHAGQLFCSVYTAFLPLRDERDSVDPVAHAFNVVQDQFYVPLPLPLVFPIPSLRRTTLL